MNILITWPGISEEGIRRISEHTNAQIWVSQNKEHAESLIAEADVGVGFVPPSLLARASRMRWLQTGYAGVEGVLAAEWGNSEMLLTNGSGIFGPNIAEQIIGMMIAFTRGLHRARDFQKEKQWRWEYTFGELYGATVGLLGYGDIGRATAERLKPFGCKMLAVRRQAPQDRAGDDLVDGVYPMDALDEVLPQCDFLVCSLPHTEQTAGLLGLDRLRMLPRTAVVVNVGRGSLLPEDDLVEALESGIISGAGLDVTEQEPLPSSSKLWELGNVLLTPHNAGNTPFHEERFLGIFLDNWDRFIEGKSLRNLVEKNHGY